MSDIVEQIKEGIENVARESVELSATLPEPVRFVRVNADDWNALQETAQLLNDALVASLEITKCMKPPASGSSEWFRYRAQAKAYSAAVEKLKAMQR